MKLNRAWVTHAFFTLLEHGAVRVLDAAATLVLIRVLTAPAFGLFSVYQSWVAVLLLFLPAIELALFREYGDIKREGRLTQELGVYRFFNALKLGAAALMVAVLACLPQESASWTVRAALLALAFALPLSQAVYSFMREPLRFEMRQQAVASLSALQRILFIGALLAASHYWPGDPRPLVALALSTYLVFGLVWAWAARDFLAGSPWLPPGFWMRLRRTFLTVVLWIHVNGVIGQAIQTLDVFSLNIWHTDLAEIGRYGIALKAANFFQILPIALTSSFGVYLAKHRGELDRGRERRLVALFSLGFVVLALALLAFGLEIGEPLLAFLAKGKLTPEALVRAVEYFHWQLGGVLLLCLSYPLTTYLSIHAPLPRLMLWVNVPWAVASLALYLFSARLGALAAARANVAVYGIALVIYLLFYAHFSRAEPAERRS